MRAGIVLLVGVPGAGKSTLAAALASRVPDARVLDKDAVRHALFDPCDYSSAERSITFTAMVDATRYHLGRGRVVVVDGLAPSPTDSEVRALEAVAAEQNGFVATIVCDVPVEVAVARVEGSAGTHVAANRDGALVRRAAAELREPPGDYLTVDATNDVDRLVAQAVGYIEDCAG